MSLSARNEKTPLREDIYERLRSAYGTSCHAQFSPCMYGVAETIVDYEPLKLSTFRIFFTRKGTIFQDGVIFIEQALITVIFLCCAIPVYYFFNQQADISHGSNASVRQWFAAQEYRMREFAMIMTFLASLLLAFYTAMAVGRWWVIRTQGIGGIKAAAMDLEMLISQLVTQDSQVLSSIRRYARASMVLVFMWRRKRLSLMKEQIVEQGLLTEDEAHALEKVNHCLHEVIWTWQTTIVCMLWQQGRIPSDQLLRTLMEKCSDGRKAIQVIHTHLAVKVPMQYIHLLGLLVKSHNLVLAMICGVLFGAAVRNGDTIICFQLAGRTLILPLLFNAVLLINSDLSDPFDGRHTTDFPGWVYQNGIEKDGSCFVKASQNRPDWMAKRSALPV